jgi:hypothetical protein
MTSTPAASRSVRSPMNRMLLRSRVNSSLGGSGAEVLNAEAHELEERTTEDLTTLLENHING